MNSLINDNFLLETNAARELYNEFAKDLPIVDYHCHIDAKENIYPRKEKPENKIDGIVALIMAMNQAIQMDVENQYLSATDQSEVDWSQFKFD